MTCSRRIWTASLLALTLLAPVAPLGFAQEESLRPGINKAYKTQDIKRAIAQFENEKRDVVRKSDEILAACGLQPAMVVADVGAGTGFFTRWFAAKVGPKGKVYAVDITEKFVDHVKKTCREEGIDNVACILSTPVSTKLPPESTDLIFTCDTYHHFEFPFKMLGSIYGALRPGGCLVVVDRKQGGGHARAGQEEVKKEVTSAGFQLIDETKATDRHYLMRFRKVRRFAQTPLTMDVWPGDVPGEKGDIGPEKVQPPKEEEEPVTRVTNVSRPTITVYKPLQETNTRTAVVICPGGGYNILAIDKEGQEVAAWLNSIGVTGIVLKYRVPRRKDRPKHLAPLQDAQRAMGLVRLHAEEWGIDPERIGILGFSAGGHLSAAASTNFGKRHYGEIDQADKLSCRPDFAVLVYPAYLMEGGSLAPEIRTSPRTPPAFFVHAGDDRISSENSIAMYLALKRAKVPAELHVYADGGHGFGLRPSRHACSTWPQRCEQWMKGRGLLEKQ